MIKQNLFLEQAFGLLLLLLVNKLGATFGSNAPDHSGSVNILSKRVAMVLCTKDTGHSSGRDYIFIGGEDLICQDNLRAEAKEVVTPSMLFISMFTMNGHLGA